jgi:hypothetical protein
LKRCAALCWLAEGSNQVGEKGNRKMNAFCYRDWSMAWCIAVRSASHTCREEKDGFLARVAAEGGVELPKVNDSIAANPSIHSCVARTRTMARSLHHTGDRTTDDGQLSLESNACVNGSIAASG